MERWYLTCEHSGPDGRRTEGTWLPDQAAMIVALLAQMTEGYYTRFIITKGTGPASFGAKQGLASGTWYTRRPPEAG